MEFERGNECSTSPEHVGIKSRHGGTTEKHVWLFSAYCLYALHDLHNPSKLDVALGEYINHCWADDVPRHKVLDSVAAVRRFLPRLCGATTTAQLYPRRWQKTLDVQRAAPLPVEVMPAMVPRPAWHAIEARRGAILNGFLEVFCTSQILTLSTSQISFSQALVATRSFKTSETAQRSGVAEFVLITDLVPTKCFSLGLEACGTEVWFSSSMPKSGRRDSHSWREWRVRSR